MRKIKENGANGERSVFDDGIVVGLKSFSVITIRALVHVRCIIPRTYSIMVDHRIEYNDLRLQCQENLQHIEHNLVKQRKTTRMNTLKKLSNFATLKLIKPVGLSSLPEFSDFNPTGSMSFRGN